MDSLRKAVKTIVDHFGMENDMISHIIIRLNKDIEVQTVAVLDEIVVK